MVEGIGFNMGSFDEKIISPAQYVNLVFELDDFTFWEGHKKIQMKLKDIRFNKMSNFEFMQDGMNASVKNADGTDSAVPGGNFAKDNIARMFSLKNLGNQYYMKKNYSKAYETYCKALEINDHPSLYYNIGLVFKCQGEYEKAVESFKKVISIEKDRYPDENSELIKKSKAMIEKIYTAAQ